MDNIQTNKDSHAQKVNAKIKATFPKLDDKDIALLASQPDQFYKAVSAKQGIDEAKAKETVKKLEAECAAACNTNAGKTATSTTNASAPVAKAS